MPNPRLIAGTRGHINFGTANISPNVATMGQSNLYIWLETGDSFELEYSNYLGLNPITVTAGFQSLAGVTTRARNVDLSYSITLAAGEVKKAIPVPGFSVPVAGFYRVLTCVQVAPGGTWRPNIQLAVAETVGGVRQDKWKQDSNPAQTLNTTDNVDRTDGSGTWPVNNYDVAVYGPSAITCLRSGASPVAIWGHGDSNTQCVVPSPGFYGWLCTALNAAHICWYSSGINGHSARGYVTDYLGGKTARVAGSEFTNVTVISLFTNDAHTGSDLATIVADYTTIINEQKAKGHKVFLSTAPPYTQGTTGTTSWNSLATQNIPNTGPDINKWGVGQVREQFNIMLKDLTSALRMLVDGVFDPSSIVSDVTVPQKWGLISYPTGSAAVSSCYTVDQQGLHFSPTAINAIAATVDTSLFTRTDYVQPTVTMSVDSGGTIFRLTFNKDMRTVAPTGLSFKVGGVVMVPFLMVWEDLRTLRIYSSKAATASSTVVCSYDPIMGEVLDVPGNELAAFTDLLITNPSTVTGGGSTQRKPSRGRG